MKELKACPPTNSSGGFCCGNVSAVADAEYVGELVVLARVFVHVQETGSVHDRYGGVLQHVRGGHRGSHVDEVILDNAFKH